ncbi:MAG: hypothetical protein JWN04_6218 [Myxococcaceae bacterium]|nr:hypothetical protein [Myxococcaceae bacterium]
MTDWRGLALFLDITGLRDFIDATVEAHYWLSISVVLRALVAFWLIGCTLLFSVRAVRVALPALSLPLRWSSILGVGMYVSTLGFHALRGLGLFNLPAAVVSASVLAAIAVYVEPSRVPWQWALRREYRSVAAVVRLIARRKYVFAVSLFAAYVLLTGARSLIVPPLGWDTITYHGPRMVHWLQTNQFTYDQGPGPYSFYRHFISGGEVLMVWTMLPFHSDLFANLGTIVQWLGVGSACWGLARALGVREPFAATSAGLIMLLPVLALEMNSGYVEAPLNLALLLGIALAVHCLRRPSGATAVAAAMSLGLAAGIKLPGAPPGVIVLAALMVRLVFARKLRLSERVRYIGLSIVAAALPVLPWAYQAYRETGYPLSPMPVKLLGLTLGVSSPAMQWYQDRPGVVPYTWGAETAALRGLFMEVAVPEDFIGPSLGATSLLPLLVALVGLLVLLRKRPLLGAVMAAALAAPWLTHFSAGLTIPRLLWSVSVARYMIVLLGLAFPVSFVWCKPGRPASQAYRRILLLISLWTASITLRFGFGGWELRELLFVGSVALLALGSCWLLFSRGVLASSGKLRMLLSGLVLALLCSALQLRRDQTRSLAYRISFALHNSPRFWAGAVAKVDEPGVVHRIALTSGPQQNADYWFHYFFFGSRLQNTIGYVPPTVDGMVAHWGPYGDLPARANRESWLSRLDAGNLTDVLTFPPRSLEQGWMDELPAKFEKLDGSSDWGLYRLRKPEVVASP